MRTKDTVFTLVLMLVVATGAIAGGPLLVFDPATRTPYSYPSGVNVYTDLGNCGPTLTNAEADALTSFAYGQWTAVSSSDFSHTLAGDFGSIGLPDIRGVNAGLVVGSNNGGGIHVMYDNDGSIISGFFGAPPGVLGIASPEFSSGATLTESWAVMNGTAVDPADATGIYFAGVFTHEFGHSINLAHSQTNGAIVFFGDSRGPSACGTPYAGSPVSTHLETMYPFIDPSFGSVGANMSTVDRLDDIASISNVNPGTGWPSSFGEISGNIYQYDGATGVTGVNVIARNVSNPWADCISALSGDFSQGALGPDGLYRFRGLTPGANYVVYIDGIVEGGFSTTPSGVPGNAEEYHNGVNESSDPLVDSRCTSTAIAVSAGTIQTADVIINQPYLSLNDDSFVEVALPFSFDFCGSVFNSVFVNANGSLTFGAGDEDFSPTVAEFLAGPPRIAAAWADLSPQEGILTAEQVGPDFVVTWFAVPEFGTVIPNIFSITLHPNGQATVSYQSMGVNNGIAGITVGGGAANPGETNLSGAPDPITGVTVYENFTAGDFDLDFNTLVFDPCPAPAKEVVPTAVTFLGVAPSDTVCETISVINNGTANLVISSVTGCDTAPFSLDLSLLDLVVGPGDTTWFEVCYSAFPPSTSDNCQITIDTNDGQCLVDVTVGSVTGVFDQPGPVSRLMLTPLPNPFRSSAEIRFSIPEPASVRLEVFDLAGRRIRTLLRGENRPSGEQSVVWNSNDDRGRRVVAGIYLVRLHTPAETKVVRAVLMP